VQCGLVGRYFLFRKRLLQLPRCPDLGSPPWCGLGFFRYSLSSVLSSLIPFVHHLIFKLLFLIFVPTGFYFGGGVVDMRRGSMMGRLGVLADISRPLYFDASASSFTILYDFILGLSQCDQGSFSASSPRASRLKEDGGFFGGDLLRLVPSGVPPPPYKCSFCRFNIIASTCT